MAARGKAVRSAVSSGRHEITKGMRKTRSIGQDIERRWKVNEVQIPGNKDALYRAFLDSLILRTLLDTFRVICSWCFILFTYSWGGFHFWCFTARLSTSLPTRRRSLSKHV
jgi:hypothetical protein